MKLYNTVRERAQAEQIIEKSRFIAYVKPVSERQEAEDFIAEIKKKHKDATHNVPAMVLGDKFQVQWASDDGEPQGTSGAPIVQMLVKEEITNVVIVVTRYFGGIKLGTGGLVRAYTSSAKLGLDAAGVCAVSQVIKLAVTIDYGSLAKFQNAEKEGIYRISDIRYGENVEIDLVTEPENLESVKSLVSNYTSGRAVINDEKEDITTL